MVVSTNDENTFDKIQNAFMIKKKTLNQEDYKETSST